MQKKQEEKRSEECVKYFKERSVYKKLFPRIREKYGSLGHMGGKVVLTGISQEEKKQLGGFLRKDYTENKTVTISVEVLKKSLDESRFSGISLEELLEIYFGKELTVNKEERQKETEEREKFFEKLWGEYENTVTGKWLEKVLKDHTKGYDILLQQYRDNPPKLQELIKNVSCAAEKLFGSLAENKISVQNGNLELLPVFAAKTTGNPHYFDRGTTAEKILLHVLALCLPEEKDAEESEPEKRNQIFYKAGILRDDISNDVLIYGIRAWKMDGTLHDGVEGFYREMEPVRMTLRTLGKISRVDTLQKRVYLFENPAVFSVFAEKNPSCGAVCVNGQPRLSALLLLDMLKGEHLFYYSGDFDPEGLLIAQRLKERYGERLSLWNYTEELYIQYLSDVALSDMRMKKLEKVHLPELQKIKNCMQVKRRAAYQEAMMERYVKAGYEHI